MAAWISGMNVADIAYIRSFAVRPEVSTTYPCLCWCQNTVLVPLPPVRFYCLSTDWCPRAWFYPTGQSLLSLEGGSVMLTIMLTDSQHVNANSCPWSALRE